jgi:5-methylcytosine-specific restriction endonuclease McrA
MDDPADIGTPKPRKADRPNLARRRERKKADRIFQAEAGGEGTCENCFKWRPLVGDHIIKRRFLATRHDPANRRSVCSECNVDFESLSAAQLLAKYPLSLLRDEWKLKAQK